MFRNRTSHLAVLALILTANITPSCASFQARRAKKRAEARRVQRCADTLRVYQEMPPWEYRMVRYVQSSGRSAGAAMANLRKEACKGNGKPDAIILETSEQDGGQVWTSMAFGNAISNIRKGKTYLTGYAIKWVYEWVKDE